MNKNSILEEMIFDEEEEFRNLVGKAKLIVKIRKSNGTPILLHRDKLTNEEQIACFLVGKYFAKEMKMTDNSEATVEEISGSLNLKKEVVRARSSDLVSKEIVLRTTRGKYEISLIKLENYLDNLLKKINGE